MAIPLAAVGLGAWGINKLFGKRPKFKTPEFFGGDYQHMVNALTQAEEAQYGTGLTDIREALANSGMLGPAALTDASTRFSIAKGQDILGIQANSYMNELMAKRNAEMEKNRIEYGADVTARGQELGFLGDIAGAYGQYLGSKKKKEEDVGTVPRSQEWISTSTGFMKNPNYQNFPRRVLRTLFGF